jgi:hypothetical protein
MLGKKCNEDEDGYIQIRYRQKKSSFENTAKFKKFIWKYSQI